MEPMQQSTIRNTITSRCVDYASFFTAHKNHLCVVRAADFSFSDKVITEGFRSDRDRLLWGPAARQSLAYCVLLNSSKLAPLYKKPSLPIYGNRSIRTAISTLLFECHPATIIWAITNGIIYTVQRQLVRVPVFNAPIIKVGEAVLPFVAHGNANRSVTFIANMFFVITSLFHGNPNLVDSGIP